MPYLPQVITGQGALAQFGYETGLSLTEVDDLVLATMDRYLDGDFEASPDPVVSVR